MKAEAIQKQREARFGSSANFKSPLTITSGLLAHGELNHD